MAKKNTSFFQKIVTGVTGKTPEQRKADAVLKGRIKAKQMASYRAEQLNQASVVGKKRAEIQAQQQIKQMSQAKPSGGLVNLGTWGKAQQGFDPFTFGVPKGRKKKKKTPTATNLFKGIAD